MKIVLFRSLPDEKWISMDLFADGVKRGLSTNGIEAIDFYYDFRRKLICKLLSNRLIKKYISYPLTVNLASGDIFHILDHSYAYLARFFKDTPLIVTCHDLFGLIDQDCTGRLKCSIKKWVLSSLDRADRIIAVSEATANDLLTKLGTKQEKIRINYQGIEPSFQPLSSELISKFATEKTTLPKEGFKILHVGGVSKRKNVESIFQVLVLLKKNFNVLTYFIKVGEEFNSYQKKLIENYQLQKHVIYLGYLSNEELNVIYNSCDIMLFPSLFEGFGRPLVEAMACRLPIVCSNTSSIPEVVESAAIMVEPYNIQAMAEAVYQILTDSKLRQSLIKKGENRASLFTWNKHAEKLIKIYQEIIS